MARIHHARPLVCPECGESMRLIARPTFGGCPTDPFSIRDVLSRAPREAWSGEPLRPPEGHPARGPPALELGFGEDWGGDMDQTPTVDPMKPAPIPRYEMDPTRSW